MGAEKFDGVHEFVVAEGGDAHLEADARDAAEGFIHLDDFGGHGLGVADHERAGWSAEGFELAPSDWRPAAFAADLGEGFGVAREEVVGGLLVGVGDVAEGVDADLEGLGSMACTLACFAVDVDEGAEAMRLAADDGDHERKAEHAGAGEGLRRAAHAEPDGERVLDGARVDALAGERGAMFAGPVDVGAFAQGEEEVKFFGEEVVVVFELEAEEREGFDEGASAGDDFGAAVGDEVESGEVLKDADGVGCAEDGDGVVRRMFLVRAAAAARMMAGAESRYSLRWCSPRPNWSRPTLSASSISSRRWAMRCCAVTMWPVMGSGTNAAKLSMPICIFIPSD